MFYPSKVGGWFYQMSDDPENDDGTDWPDEMDFNNDGTVTMNPDGPTDFGLGKNIQNFDDSIGGCNMDFEETQQRGFANEADDARDVEMKCIMRVEGTGSNGFSISACTGHHTGDGCCQGFAYMITVEVSDNPSVFNFRKEMWHVSYHNSPLGEFSHPVCNFRIRDHGWVGLGFCRYNTPGSENTSVTLEVWFNPDPDDDLNNWTMVKRYVDKPGNGWGNDGDECGGDSDQVGTWSNAQNRFKTNATSGSIDFKMVTLREINPSGSFDEVPPDPDPDPGPGPGPVPSPGGGGNPDDDPAEPTEVHGTFVFKRDINILRSSACEGSTGGGGGGGGSAIFYSNSTVDDEKELSNAPGEPYDNRTRVGQRCHNTSSGMFNKVLKQWNVNLRKQGSPGATPVINAKIYNSSGAVVYTSPTNFDPSTLPGSFGTDTTAWAEFDFSTNTHQFVVGDMVAVEYITTSTTNYVLTAYDQVTSTGNEQQVQYENSPKIWEIKNTRDMNCVMWS